MDKVYPSVDEVVADIPDGASIAIAGFFTAGTPVPLIKALARRGVKGLTIICQQMGPGNEDVNQLVLNKQVKRAICNYPFYRSLSRGADNPFEAVRWTLDIFAKHCIDCPRYGAPPPGRVYSSWDAMLVATGGVAPGHGTQCDGYCRCELSALRDGVWVTM